VFPAVVTHVHTLTRARPRPWLVVGKGPTADHLPAVDQTQYHVLTLNHACRVVPAPAVCHFVDVEAVDACKARLAELAGTETAVCLPWHPHHKFRAGEMDLGDWLDLGWYGDVLNPYRAAGRLLTYNATTAHKLPRLPGCHTVTLKAFGAVAAFNILVLAGVTQIHSLGVDGGTGYGAAFDGVDRLANGRPNFDAQLPHIRAAVAARPGVTWVRLFSPAAG